MEEQSTVRHCLSPLKLLQNVKYYFPPSDNRLSFTKEPQRCYLQSGSVGCRYLISVWPSKYLPQLKTRNPNHFLPFTKKKTSAQKSNFQNIYRDTAHWNGVRLFDSLTQIMFEEVILTGGCQQNETPARTFTLCSPSSVSMVSMGKAKIKLNTEIFQSGPQWETNRHTENVCNEYSLH